MIALILTELLLIFVVIKQAGDIKDMVKQDQVN
jgi:hypothetical protein